MDLKDRSGVEGVAIRVGGIAHDSCYGRNGGKTIGRFANHFVAHKAAVGHAAEVPSLRIGIKIGFKIIHQFFEKTQVVSGGDAYVHVGIPCVLQTRGIAYDKALRFGDCIELGNIHESGSGLGKAVQGNEQGKRFVGLQVRRNIKMKNPL